ncbi:MAG: TonB-dependent receptor [Muribaculaceae bacterium]|nr:TonB-dependent receptor [Muribaculaceae bacterium]MDE6321118.1 TonB-dependent receptor [Muribaculaceae bacterium]
MKKLFLLLVMVIGMAVTAAAQNHTVRGTILDASNGDPLIGVTVMPVGGGQGVATDMDGKFTLSVPANVSKLKVSYVGFTEKTVNIKSGDMVVKLDPSSKALDEVMVVAYGTAKKSAFTGSATVVGAAEIEKVQVTNVLDALSGNVAGVQLTNASGAPGQENPTIRVRGITSIMAGNDPLVVVDGVPYSGDINNFSTSDIESMTVLKDAASNALYGARGANGVILITTKKGKEQNAVVTLDAKWGCNSRATRDYDIIGSAAGYYEMYYKMLNNYAMNAQGMNAAAANAWANQNMIDPSSDNPLSLGYNVFTLPVDGNGNYLPLIGMDGRINPYATLGRTVNYNGQEYYLHPDSWLNNAYDKSLRQEYNVSVSNATDKGNFYTSFSWLSNDGIVQNTDYTRLTGTLRGEIQAKPWLKVGGNAMYTRSKSRALDEDGESASSANVFAAAQQVAPIYPLFVRDGAGNVMIDAYGNQIYDWGDNNAGLTRPVYGQSNAIAASRLDKNYSESNAFNGTAFVEVRFLKDFKFTANNNVTLDETRVTNVTNPYYGLYKDNNGIVAKGHYRRQTYTFQQLLNWNRMFGNHNVGLLLGHENYWDKYYVLTGSKYNMFDPNNAELIGAIINQSASSYTTEYNVEGWFARAQYDYNSKYFVSASIRRDGSSRFHPDHRWGNFWSGGAAWLLDKEDWFTASWVDQLKLKASYGEQGNDQIGNYRYTNTYTIVNSDGHPAAQPSTYGNPNISWEKNMAFNGGVEFSLFNDRLSGNLEYYWRRTKDQLFTVPMAPSFGFSSYYTNIGDMDNQGLEFGLSAYVVRTKDLTVELNGNFTYSKNKIARLPESRKSQTCDGVKGFSSGDMFYGEGQPMYTFWLPKYAGTDKVTGEALYYINVKDDKGNVTQTVTTDYSKLESTNGDYHLCGSALPWGYGGFGLTVNYKWFDFAVNFNYQCGGKIYDSNYASLMGNFSGMSNPGSNLHKDLLNAWSPENPTSNIPRVQYGDDNATQTSDRFLISASYLQLRSVNFGFTLPKDLTRKLSIDRVRLYLTADNIALWSARKGLNPTQSISGGANNTYYAPVRVVSGGVNVVF